MTKLSSNIPKKEPKDKAIERLKQFLDSRSPQKNKSTNKKLFEIQKNNFLKIKKANLRIKK